jgi:hypothetical protein
VHRPPQRGALLIQRFPIWTWTDSGLPTDVPFTVKNPARLFCAGGIFYGCAMFVGPCLVDYDLQNRKRSSLHFTLCVSVRPCGAPG